MKKAVESNPSERVSNPCNTMATINASNDPIVVTYTITEISLESFKALIFMLRVLMANISATNSITVMHSDKNITHEKESVVKQLIPM